MAAVGADILETEEAGVGPVEETKADLETNPAGPAL